MITDKMTEAALSTGAEPVKPICNLVWKQYLRAADDVEDYFEVARPGDKCVDGSDPFPVYTAPPAPTVAAPQTLVNLATAVLAQAPATANEFMSISLDDIRSALSAQVQDVAMPEGWQLVPVEPTEEMLKRGAGSGHGILSEYGELEVWSDMLSAAPAAKREEKS